MPETESPQSGRIGPVASDVSVGMITMGYGRMYPGGAEQQAELLANELGTRGRRIVVFAPATSVRSKSESDAPNVRLVRVPCLGLPRTRSATFLPMLAARQIAPGFDHPGILHTHMAWYQAVIPEVVRPFTKARTVVKFACSGVDGEMATMSRSLLGRQALRIIGRSDRVIALTDAVAAELRSGGFRADRIVRIPNGVAVGEASTMARDLAGMSRPTVLFAGRLSHQKGILPLLDAWPTLAQSGTRPLLLVAGTGPLLEAVRDRIAAPDLLDDVRLLGHRADLGAVIATVDAVIIPSRSEGMSNVALQALSERRATFGFAIPGVAEVIHDPRALAQPGDLAGLLALLSAGLRSRPLREELAGAGRERVEREFAIGSIASRYEEVYDGLVA